MASKELRKIQVKHEVTLAMESLRIPRHFSEKSWFHGTFSFPMGSPYRAPYGGGQRQVVPKYLSSPLPVLVLGWARFLGSLAFRLLGGFGLASFGFYLAWIWLGLALAGFGLLLPGFWVDLGLIFAFSIAFTMIFAYV